MTVPGKRTLKEDTMMTFKKIVEAMAKGASVDELCGVIDSSFQSGKINWNDHETLYALVNRLG